jgi:thiamine monophosphate kinase
MSAKNILTLIGDAFVDVGMDGQLDDWSVVTDELNDLLAPLVDEPDEQENIQRAATMMMTVAMWLKPGVREIFEAIASFLIDLSDGVLDDLGPLKDKLNELIARVANDPNMQRKLRAIGKILQAAAELVEEDA